MSAPELMVASLCELSNLEGSDYFGFYLLTLRLYLHRIPASRPDSPSGLATELDGAFDWTYARRELALARLNGQDPGLDALRDEDLDDMFDGVSLTERPIHPFVPYAMILTGHVPACPVLQIQKARTLRKSRPESRMGSEEFWGINESGQASRHLSSIFTDTDDTSVPSASDANPWTTLLPSPAIPETPTSNNVVGTNAGPRIREAGSDAGFSTGAQSQDDHILEMAHMERSISLLKGQMARLLEARSRGAEIEDGFEEPHLYSAREIRLATTTLTKWKNLARAGTFAMVEAVRVDLLACDLCSPKAEHQTDWTQILLFSPWSLT